MKRLFSAALLVTVFCSILASALQEHATPANPRPAPSDKTAAASADMPDEQTQNEYAMLVLDLVNVASEIHAGRATRLAESIETSLPEYLAQMTGFKETPLKIATFHAASLLYKSAKKQAPADLEALISSAGAKAKGVESDDCYELLPVCKEKGCIPLPISLRPVDVKKIDPMGWHYLVGSNCGFKNWKRWKFWQFGQGCGPPLGVTACTGDNVSATTPPNQTAPGAPGTPAAASADLPDEETQNNYAMLVLNLINVASEIHAGRSQQLKDAIATSLPEYLTQMTGFKESPLKTATFHAASLLFKSLQRQPPANLEPLMGGAGAKAKDVLSDDCYELLPVCKEKGCVPVPISLRPVDVNKVDPMGWHYLVGSNCGFKNWKRWKFWQIGQGCGPPLGVTACTGDNVSTTMPPGETARGMQVPETQRLPEGAIFATASVDPDTTIEVQQPGYAVIATADVVSVKRVNPGDRLDAKTTSSVHFDDGTGVLVNVLKKGAAPIAATVGLVSLLAHDRPQPLPVNNGSTTMYVGSDQPFANPALIINNQNKVPDVTQAVFLNPKGEKTGQLSTFNGLQTEIITNLAVGTVDNKGTVLQEGKVGAGVLDGTPKVSFDKPTYKPGEKGQLRIQNQENYQKLVDMTRFGGGAQLPSEPIRIIPLSDVKGLPAQTPYGTTSLSFEAVHPGQARVAVIFPRAVPPKPVPDPGNDEGLKQSNAAFERWRSQFPK